MRPATSGDLDTILDLAAARRAIYEGYQPQFWRRAPDARAHQAPFFARLLENDRTLVLVAERAGQVVGFLIAQLVPAPPVYAPGGLTCAVDDFWLAEGEDWLATGGALLDESMRQAKGRGAAQAVVVCAHLDAPKRAMLAARGFAIASEWHVHEC
jgi:hypothetical protein